MAKRDAAEAQTGMTMVATRRSSSVPIGFFPFHQVVRFMSSSLNICTGPFDQANFNLTSTQAAEKSRLLLAKQVFAVSVILVAATSAYDAFLVYRYRFAVNEQNPICAWLISLEPEYVSCFLLGKGLGTLIVVSVLIYLFRYWRRAAIPVALSLVLFQLGLMTYLHGTDGRSRSNSEFAVLHTLRGREYQAPLNSEPPTDQLVVQDSVISNAKRKRQRRSRMQRLLDYPQNQPRLRSKFRGRKWHVGAPDNR